MPRTQQEIVDRIVDANADDDFMGFRREVLLDALEFEHAKPYLKDGVTEAEWDASREKDTQAAARGYLDFAVGKIEDHRGISASRSVEKLGEYAWLLGRDDVVAAMAAADYPQYGAPKVKAFAEGMGWPWPPDAGLARMAEGLPCTEDCYGGCGS
jgi:hypothetical protein